MKHSYTTSVLGTPEFMAPELYEENYGPEVDVYAFGMAMLEMLTHEPPYKECQNPAQIYKKVINRDYPVSMSRIQDETIKKFIMQCLDSREKRPTAAQLLEQDFMKDLSKDGSNDQYVEVLASNTKGPKTIKPKVHPKPNMPVIEEMEENNDTQFSIKTKNTDLTKEEHKNQESVQKNIQDLHKNDPD